MDLSSNKANRPETAQESQYGRHKVVFWRNTTWGSNSLGAEVTNGK